MLLVAGGCGGRLVPDASGDGAPTGTTKGGTSSSGSQGGATGSGGSSTGGDPATGGGGAGGDPAGGSGVGGWIGGGATGTATCTDLPSRTLASVGDAIAALTAPFPNAWQLCAGYTFEMCPKDAPYVSFDATGTHASCGSVYEGGFRATTTFPIQLTQDETGVIRLRWAIPDGTASVFVQSFGDDTGARALSFSMHGDPPPPPARLVPTPPLP